MRAFSRNDETGGSIAWELQNLEAATGKLKARLAEIELEISSLNDASVDRDQLVAALSLFDPVWDVLYPVEKSRVIDLMLHQIVYYGATDNPCIELHPIGIRSLANETAG